MASLQWCPAGPYCPCLQRSHGLLRHLGLLRGLLCGGPCGHLFRLLPYGYPSPLLLLLLLPRPHRSRESCLRSSRRSCPRCWIQTRQQQPHPQSAARHLRHPPSHLPIRRPCAQSGCGAVHGGAMPAVLQSCMEQPCPEAAISRLHDKHTKRCCYCQKLMKLRFRQYGSDKHSIRRGYFVSISGSILLTGSFSPRSSTCSGHGGHSSRCEACQSKAAASNRIDQTEQIETRMNGWANDMLVRCALSGAYRKQQAPYWCREECRFRVYLSKYE